MQSDQRLPARQLPTARPQRCHLQATAEPGNGRGTQTRTPHRVGPISSRDFCCIQSSSTSPPCHWQKQKQKGHQKRRTPEEADGRPTRPLAKSLALWTEPPSPSASDHRRPSKCHCRCSSTEYRAAFEVEGRTDAGPAAANTVTLYCTAVCRAINSDCSGSVSFDFVKVINLISVA